MSHALCMLRQHYTTGPDQKSDLCLVSEKQ